MLRVERDVLIARRVEDVFAFVADFDNFTAWSTDVVKAELLTPGPTRVGTKARITRTVLGQPFVMDFELVTYEPNRAIGFRGAMLGVPFASRMDFAPLNGAGVEVTQSGEVIVPPLLFMVEPTARQVLGTTFENDLRKLKQLMEAGQDA